MIAHRGKEPNAGPMSEACGIDMVHRFFPGTGTTYDRVVNLCTLGFDRRWKERMMRYIPAGSARIMDQACGTGILTFMIARAFPDARIVGVDVTEEYLAIARAKAAGLRTANVELVPGRAEEVLLDRRFDCIVSSYLAKYAELGNLISNAKTMLTDGGVLVMHDFTYPANSAVAVFWRLHFRLLQTAGAWRYPQWKAAFDGLPGFLRETRWVPELVGALRANHFSDISVRPLFLGTAAIVTARKGR